MSIVGIHNRTENNKTANTLSPALGIDVRHEENRLKLVREILKPDISTDKKIEIELFWYGFRDYVHAVLKDREKEEVEQEKKRLNCIIRESYKNQFGRLHDQFVRYKSDKTSKFKDKKGVLPNPDINYNINYLDSVDVVIEKSRKKRGWGSLASNLMHTEIDIVIDTGDHNNALLIGEAKAESSLSVTGDHFLPHQLLRQYVATSILMSMIPCGRCVIPFIVCDKPKNIRNSEQVDFMVKMNWLRTNRIFSWEYLEDVLSTS